MTLRPRYMSFKEPISADHQMTLIRWLQYEFGAVSFTTVSHARSGITNVIGLKIYYQPLATGGFAEPIAKMVTPYLIPAYTTAVEKVTKRAVENISLRLNQLPKRNLRG